MKFNLDEVQHELELNTLEGNDEVVYVLNEWEAKRIAEYLIENRYEFSMNHYDERCNLRRYDFNPVQGYVFD